MVIHHHHVLCLGLSYTLFLAHKCPTNTARSLFITTAHTGMYLTTHLTLGAAGLQDKVVKGAKVAQARKAKPVYEEEDKGAGHAQAVERLHRALLLPGPHRAAAAPSCSSLTSASSTLAATTLASRCASTHLGPSHTCPRWLSPRWLSCLLGFNFWKRATLASRTLRNVSLHGACTDMGPLCVGVPSSWLASTVAMLDVLNVCVDAFAEPQHRR